MIFFKKKKSEKKTGNIYSHNYNFLKTKIKPIKDCMIECYAQIRTGKIFEVMLSRLETSIQKEKEREK